MVAPGLVDSVLTNACATLQTGRSMAALDKRTTPGSRTNSCMNVVTPLKRIFSKEAGMRIHKIQKMTPSKKASRWIAKLFTVAGFVAYSLFPVNASALLVDIAPEDFVVPKLITFNAFPVGLVIDGVSSAGVTYGFSIDGTASSDASIGSGAGTTLFVSPPNIEGNADGILSIRHSYPVHQIGYGFAISYFGTTGDILTDVTTVELFDEFDNSLGILSGDAAAYTHEGLFTGFLGVESTIAFSRADVSWDFEPWDYGTGSLYRFAFDNLMLGPSPIPEPASIFLFGIGLIGLALRCQRKVK